MTKFESLFLYPGGCTCICMYKSLSICTYKSLYRTRWDITEGHHKVKEVTALFHFHWKVITMKQLNYADNLNLILLHTKYAAAEKTKLLQKSSSFDSSVISYKRITYESRTFSTWVFSYAVPIFLFLPCWPHFWVTSYNWDRVLWEIIGRWSHEYCYLALQAAGLPIQFVAKGKILSIMCKFWQARNKEVSHKMYKTIEDKKVWSSKQKHEETT